MKSLDGFRHQGFVSTAFLTDPPKTAMRAKGIESILQYRNAAPRHTPHFCNLYPALEYLNKTTFKLSY